MHALELKVPPVAQVIIVASVMWAISLALPIADFHVPARIWLSVIFCSLGVAAPLMGVIAFRKAKTTVDPRVPHETTKLVVHGVYKISRNPMYLGFLLVLGGWAIFLANSIAILLIPIFVIYMNRFQIAPEERYMLEKFGTEFQAYASHVRRWI